MKPGLSVMVDIVEIMDCDDIVNASAHIIVRWLEIPTE